MKLQPESRPRLRPGCRFSESPGQENVLLIPEGVLNLTGPARAILELCNGARTFAEIVTALQQTYQKATPEQIERETAPYLEKLQERHVVEYS